MKSNYFQETDYIHYSNCYEDFLLLKKYLPNDAKTILSIAGGLDNALSFLEKDDVKVFAIDQNRGQVLLSKLKVAAIQQLNYEEFKIFMGFEKGDALSLYHQLRLDSEVQDYFDHHLYLIESKLIHIGRFEHYFQLFKRRILPWVVSKKKVRQFMQFQRVDEQRIFYYKYINNLRFKLLFKIFFSKKVMAKLGRDKSFFIYSKGGLAKRLKERVEIGLTSIPNRYNPYLQYAMLNEFIELPYYAQKENFEKIKKNIGNIEIKHETFEKAILSYENIDFMNLSDIFEYMPADISNLEKKVFLASHKGTRIAFWNMMNERKFSSLKRINDSIDILEDRAMYYQDFLVYEVDYD